MSFRQKLQQRESIPLHRKIYEEIRHEISSGRLRAGDLLPPEEELRRTFKVSRFTLRQALDGLAREGLIIRHRGKGTFVARPRIVEQPLGGFYSFARVMAGKGISQHSKVLELSSSPASKNIAEQFQVDRGEPMVKVVRLRYAEGEPLVLETSYLLHRLARNFTVEDLSDGSIYDLLELKAGVSVSGAREIIRPVVLSSYQAGVLEAVEGSAAFQVERVALAGEMVVEWRVSLIRGDRYAYVAELPRVS